MPVAIITGAGGLIGSEAVDHFVGQGFAVVGIENDMRARFFGPESSTSQVTQRLVDEPGAEIHDYPRLQYILNRLANQFIRLLFRHHYNDTTNAFKAYRRKVIETVQPLLSKHFNLTVELPLKAIVRGHSFAVVPTSWTNRTSGEAKLAMKEMGSRYVFIVLYVWLEKVLSRVDYQVREPRTGRAAARIGDSP